MNEVMKKIAYGVVAILILGAIYHSAQNRVMREGDESPLGEGDGVEEGESEGEKDEGTFNKGVVWEVAKEFVLRELRSPSTAFFDDERLFGGQNCLKQVEYKGNGVYVVNGWVDSQNSFGAVIRMKWVVKVREEGDGWHALEGPYFLE
jgi:hypothetical protein